MEGSQTLRLRCNQFVAILATSFIMSAGPTGAQNPLSPSDTRVPISGVLCAPEAGCSVDSGFIETITQSIFGKPDPNTWHPLPLSTFFSEGWNEAWAPSPKGSGGGLRQGWINAVNGTLPRTGFFTFAQGFNNPPDGNAYLGAFTLLTQLSRRLEIVTNIPFVVRNNASGGLPTLGPNPRPVTITESHTGFGDISITPRVLVHETKDLSITAELAVLTPTGNGPLAGQTALTPAVAFWNNIFGRCVIRGGIGLFIPMQGGGGDTLISQLAVGQTLTDHDVPWFGDFTYYIAAVGETPLSNSEQTSLSLTPGIRTHLGNDWYLQAGIPTPVTKQRVADFGLICWLMKAW
jgi:hypothetical protein